MIVIHNENWCEFFWKPKRFFLLIELSENNGSFAGHLLCFVSMHKHLGTIDSKTF